MKKISPAAIIALKEALTNIYWYKNDLQSFLRSALSSTELVINFNPDVIKRELVSNLVDKMIFDEAKYQDDFLTLMITVSEVNDFTHLKQLEDGHLKVKKAQDSVNALREIVKTHKKLLDEREGSKKKMELEKQESLKRKAANEMLEELKSRYYTLHSLSPQEKGYALEILMKDIFDVFDLDPKASFKVEGEQIDGAFSFETTDYIFECKWQKDLVDGAQLDSFKGKISRKLENTLGLYLSINGFNNSSIKLHSANKSVMILMDGTDLNAVLEGRIRLEKLLLRKRRHASQTGNIFLGVRDIL